jgi:hypothetical protein
MNQLNDGEVLASDFFYPFCKAFGVWIRFDISPLDHDPDLAIFAAIASQADHLPCEEARKLCAAKWLRTCYREAREIEAFYRAQVESHCAQLTRRFSRTA